MLNLVSRNSLPGSKVIKKFTCSTQLSMKYIMLINDEMPTIANKEILQSKYGCKDQDPIDVKLIKIF